MSDVEQAAALDLGAPRGRSPLLKWAIIGFVALLVLGGGGGAAWYFLLGGHSKGEAKEVKTPLPFFLEVKPIVVSLPSKGGVSHFVQVGLTLQLPRPAAGEMVGALLPEVQDTIRQTLLSFKSDDLQSPEGVDNVRKVMIEHLNVAFNAVLGADRIAKFTAGNPNHDFVQNVLFPVLIVE